MSAAPPASDLERRKQVKLRIRADLSIEPQRYEGRTFYVVKDPVSLRYYRFKEHERFLIKMMNGTHTLDEAQKEFEKQFRPQRLPLEELEQFAQQLLTAGLAHNEFPQSGKQLFDRRKKRRRTEWLAALTNILYIKIPIYDPDKLLGRMLPYLRWIFTTWFFVLSVGVMLAAVLLVLTHFQTFRDKLPAYHEFFSFKTVVYLWVALGCVKVIHEFGHGLSCKAFGGEVHEMGALFLCLSPCLYCNVSDAWTLPNKWKRIIISFAGIYVELIIAAISTFVWWNSSTHPFINNMSLSLMIVCSVSTVVFNANPLMRFDGYYVLADWLEIPNLRDQSNRFLKTLVQEHCFGIEVQPEPYMAMWRRVLFVSYAIGSFVYRWVVTFGILLFLYNILGPKLRTVSAAMVLAAVGSLVGWPAFRMGKAYHRRGRLPDMSSKRVTITCGVLAAILAFVLLVPLPVSRVRQTALVQVQPTAIQRVYVPYSAILEKLYVRDGETVVEGQALADFRSLDVENDLDEAHAQWMVRGEQLDSLRVQLAQASSPAEQGKLEHERAVVEGQRGEYAAQEQGLKKKKDQLKLVAPRAGIVMSPPHLDEVGKLWEKEQSVPFCGIGDPKQLQVLMPVGPADRRLLVEDHASELPVTIRVQGRDSDTWKGRIVHLDESESKDVPVALTAKGGGPLAVKPSAQPNVNVPQSQQYLVTIKFEDTDAAICPGTLAQVKVHCHWRTCGWWFWRTVSSAFDVGLW